MKHVWIVTLAVPSDANVCGTKKDEYTGDSARTFRERLKEHFWAASPICDHANITDHLGSVNNFSIVGRV